MDDRALIEAFQAGDTSAFDALVERHRRRVYRVARSVLRTHEAADEAAQEAFIKAHQALRRFEGRSSFTTWIHRITINAALDLRAREAARERARRASEAEHAAERAPPTPRALEALIRQERLQALRGAMHRLPERQRLTMLLRVRDGLKYQEIAETLECPVGTVKANFHHAVTNLRKILGESGREPPSADGSGGMPTERKADPRPAGRGTAGRPATRAEKTHEPARRRDARRTT